MVMVRGAAAQYGASTASALESLDGAKVLVDSAPTFSLTTLHHLHPASAERRH